MNVSVLDQNNAFYNGVNIPWAYAWSCQKDVTSTIVTATGGTYEVVAPKDEEAPKKAVKTKK
jgi:hypothetical protein